MDDASDVRIAGDLPVAVTSFIGRGAEVRAIRKRMSATRLVTLVGPGGVGKSRLAAEVGRQVVRAFRDGVWVIDLAPLRDGADVADAVLSVLGVRDQSARPTQTALTAHLAGRQILLVIESCEHLLESVGLLVAALLRAAPSVHVLATSREPLGVAGEHLVDVAPLPTPDPSETHDPRGLEQYAAVALLVERARAVRPDFAVTEDNAYAIARLCARLDGLPLAIELAASRLRTLSLLQVDERMNDRFALLSAGTRDATDRQRTLRALIDWSYDLCTPREQLLWGRLSVFPGPFGLRAAETVCTDERLAPDDVIDVLDRLVAKSIVIADSSDDCGTRFRMLDTVRDYGAELLDNAGERDLLRWRHREHFQREAHAIVERWFGPGQVAALARVRAERVNFRAALEYSLTPEEAAQAAILAASLRYHWVAGGFLNEGRRWLDRALELVRDPAARAEALWVAIWVSLLQGDMTAVSTLLAEYTTLAERLQQPSLLARGEHRRATAALFSGDAAASLPMYERALVQYEQARNLTGQSIALFELIIAATYAGAKDRAVAAYEEATALSAAHDERWARMYTTWAYALHLWRSGDVDAAGERAAAALELARDFESGLGEALTLELLAWISTSRAEHERGARLFGAAAAIWDDIGTNLRAFGPHLEDDSAGCAQRARGALGASRFEAVFAKARTLSLDEVLGVESGTSAPVQRSASDEGLSPRELEVAGLIGRGLSNRAIAEELVVSPRTVETHVARILAKLGFASRTQIAAWVGEHATSR